MGAAVGEPGLRRHCNGHRRMPSVGKDPAWVHDDQGDAAGAALTRLTGRAKINGLTKRSPTLSLPIH